MSRLSCSMTTPVLFSSSDFVAPRRNNAHSNAKQPVPPGILKSATDPTNGPGPRLTTFIDCSLSLSDLSAYITAKTLSPVVAPKPFKADASPYEMLDTLGQASPLDALGRSLSPNRQKLATLSSRTPNLAVTSPSVTSGRLRAAGSELIDLSWVGTPVLLDHSVLQRDDFGDVTVDSTNAFVTPRTHLESEPSLTQLAGDVVRTHLDARPWIGTATPNFDDNDKHWKVDVSDILSTAQSLSTVQFASPPTSSLASPPIPDVLSPSVPGVMSPLAGRIIVSPMTIDGEDYVSIDAATYDVTSTASHAFVVVDYASGQHPSALLPGSESLDPDAPSFDLDAIASAALNTTNPTTPARKTPVVPPTPANTTLEDVDAGLTELSLERWAARDHLGTLAEVDSTSAFGSFRPSRFTVRTPRDESAVRATGNSPVHDAVVQGAPPTSFSVVRHATRQPPRVLHPRAAIRVRVVGHGIEDVLVAPGQLAAAIAAPWAGLDLGSNVLNIDDAAEARDYLQVAVDMREYEKALEETLQARRELKRVSKMARWWKRRAGEKGKGKSAAERKTAAVRETTVDRTSTAKGEGERSTERETAAGRASCEEREPAEERGSTEGRKSAEKRSSTEERATSAARETETGALGEKRTSLFGLLQAAQAAGKASSDTAVNKPTFNKSTGTLTNKTFGSAPTNRSASAPSAIPARTSRLPTLAGRRASNASVGWRGSASSVGSAPSVRRSSVDSQEQPASSPTRSGSSSPTRSGSSSPSTLDPVTPVRTSSLPGTGIQKPAAMFKSPDSIMAFISV